MTDEALLKLK